MKLLFATDLHGSNTVFSKCLRLLSDGTADILLLGGDLAGKGLAPIVQKGNSWVVYEDKEHPFGRSLSAQERQGYEQKVSAAGLYPWICSADSFEQLRVDE